MTVPLAPIERHIRQERLLAEELERYAGEWVAVRDHQVIAHAKSADKLYEQLAEEEQSYRTLRVSSGSGAALL